MYWCKLCDVQYSTGTSNVLVYFVIGAEISTFEHRDFLTCVAYHPVNPNYILAGSKDRVLCWDIRCPEACMKVFDYKHSFGQVIYHNFKYSENAF